MGQLACYIRGELEMIGEEKFWCYLRVRYPPLCYLARQFYWRNLGKKQSLTFA